MFRTAATRVASQICLRPILTHSRHLSRTIAPTRTPTASATLINFVRLKHVTSGIQGNRNSKQKAFAKKRIVAEEDEVITALLDNSTELNLINK